MKQSFKAQAVWEVTLLTSQHCQTEAILLSAQHLRSHWFKSSHYNISVAVHFSPSSTKWPRCLREAAAGRATIVPAGVRKDMKSSRSSLIGRPSSWGICQTARSFLGPRVCQRDSASAKTKWQRRRREQIGRGVPDENNIAGKSSQRQKKQKRNTDAASFCLGFFSFTTSKEAPRSLIFFIVCKSNMRLIFLSEILKNFKSLRVVDVNIKGGESFGAKNSEKKILGPSSVLFGFSK